MKSRDTGMTGTRNVTWLVAVTATLLLAGCQASPPITSVRYDNIGFMALWKTYTHCLSTEDSQLAVEDAQKLSSMSRIDTTVSSRPKHALLSIPFAGDVPQTTARLAVDVQAMAASCSLHTGILATSAGESELARDHFQKVVNNHTQAAYSYYRDQARAHLYELEISRQASLH